VKGEGISEMTEKNDKVFGVLLVWNDENAFLDSS
jgi:hypothetical protein